MSVECLDVSLDDDCHGSGKGTRMVDQRTRVTGSPCQEESNS